MMVCTRGYICTKPGGTAGDFQLLSQQCWDRSFFISISFLTDLENKVGPNGQPKWQKGKIMSEEKKIPYKIYLEENEMPKQWYNVRADMKNKPAPLLNPATLEPMGYEDLRPVFCDELIKQELDNDTAYIDIPQEILDFYKMYRPAPLVRAYCLEKALGTPAKIYYKFEGNNTSGSHKLNSAIAQAYYAKKQGLKGVTTETGAGQWGTALSMACAYLGLDCKVYMVKVSYEQKPFRREVMRTYGASVTPSPPVSSCSIPIMASNLVSAS